MDVHDTPDSPLMCLSICDLWFPAIVFLPQIILIERTASGRSLVHDLYNQTRLHLKAIPTFNEFKEERAFLITEV